MRDNNDRVSNIIYSNCQSRNIFKSAEELTVLDLIITVKKNFPHINERELIILFIIDILLNNIFINESTAKCGNPK